MEQSEQSIMHEILARMSSPRPDTPEPSSKQGRRNGNNSQDVQLLDADGAISEKFEVCLKHVFAKYCTPSGLRQEGAAAEQQPADGGSFLVPPPNAYLSMKGLDEWAKDTNGTPFSQETKDELIEFLDVTDEGCLTLKGFLQIYQLQTENDEEETWRDLSSHGFDRSLQLVYTRREEDVEGDIDTS